MSAHNNEEHSSAYEEHSSVYLDAWREQVDRARRKPPEARLGFLEPLFIHYRESVKIAEMKDQQT